MKRMHKESQMIKKTIKLFLLILALQITLSARVINIDNLITTANKTQKHLFIWLHKTDCGFCENMREFTLENEVIKNFIENHFIFVHINVYEKDSLKYKEFRGNSREFAKEIGYDFYPASIFFDSDGDIAFAEVGFIDSVKKPNEKRFFKILNYIDSKSYKKIQYSDYKFITKEEL
jgi:thioredoxin-related protein